MILAIDIGTTFLKVAVVDNRGKIHFSDKSKLDVLIDKDKREMNPLSWVESIQLICSAINSNISKDIISVVISGNGPTLLAVDSAGRAIGNAILWMDKRSDMYAGEIAKKLGEFIPPNFFLSKAYYYEKKLKDNSADFSSYISCPEYISSLLTGESYTSLPGNGFKRFYWNDDKLKKLGLNSNHFPDFKQTKEIYGNYDGSGLLGQISKGIPVICGGPDFVMSVLGSGAVRDGILCDRTGTSEGLNYCSRERLDIEGLRTLPHIDKELYTIAGLIPDSGELVLNKKYNELVDQYKSQVDLMIANGLNIEEVRVIGGHSGILELNEMKSRVLDVPLKVYPSGSELIGNAVFGFWVLGIYSTLSQACSSMVREEMCLNA